MTLGIGFINITLEACASKGKINKMGKIKNVCTSKNISKVK